VDLNEGSRCNFSILSDFGLFTENVVLWITDSEAGSLGLSLLLILAWDVAACIVVCHCISV